jgi:Fe-S-cluster containining protein
MSLLNIATDEKGVVINFDKNITRTCGTCVACCIWTEIKEINKPSMVPCQHLKEGAVAGKSSQNCTIYEGKPAACKEYFCSWIAGYGEEEDQPNRCGVLIDPQVTAKYGLVLFARDLWPGATEMSMGRRAIKRISEEMNLVAIVTDDSIGFKRMEGPKELLQKFQE